MFVYFRRTLSKPRRTHFGCRYCRTFKIKYSFFFSLACLRYFPNEWCCYALNISFSVNILWRWQRWRNIERKKNTDDDNGESSLFSPNVVWWRRMEGEMPPAPSRRGTEWVIADNFFDDILRTCCFSKGDAHHCKTRRKKQSFRKLQNVYAG